MSPILGIWASARQPALNNTSYESIATINVTSAVASIEFTSIVSDYTHLQIRCIARSTESVSSNSIIMYLNNVTTAASNYSTHLLWGNGSSVSAYGASNDVIQNIITAGSNGANNFGAVVFDILDYTNTNKLKPVRALGGYDDNGSGVVRFSSGMLHSSTAAITRIKLQPSGGNFAQYSSFALYGIRGA